MRDCTLQAPCFTTSCGAQNTPRSAGRHSLRRCVESTTGMDTSCLLPVNLSTHRQFQSCMDVRVAKSPATVPGASSACVSHGCQSKAWFWPTLPTNAGILVLRERPPLLATVAGATLNPLRDSDRCACRRQNGQILAPWIRRPSAGTCRLRFLSLPAGSSRPAEFCSA